MPKKGKKGKGNSNSSVQMQRGGFPDRERVKLVYSADISRSPATTVHTDYVFSGNGLFDCDITGTGGQPANYDDFSAIYARYRVYGSKIVVRMWSPGSLTGAGVFRICLAPRHLTTAVTDIAGFHDAQSQPFAQAAIFYGGNATSRGTTMEMRKSMTTKVIMGYKQSAVDDDDTLAALTSANPNHQWYWHLIAGMMDGSSSGTVYYNLEIEYDVEFYDRVDTGLDFKLMRVPRNLTVPPLERKEEKKVLSVITTDDPLVMPESPQVPERYVLVPASSVASNAIPSSTRSGAKVGGR